MSTLASQPYNPFAFVPINLGSEKESNYFVTVRVCMGMRYVTPYYYAKLCGLTRQAIYNRINKGTLTVALMEGPTGELIRYIDMEVCPPCRKPWGGGRPRKQGEEEANICDLRDDLAQIITKPKIDCSA